MLDLCDLVTTFFFLQRFLVKTSILKHGQANRMSEEGELAKLLHKRRNCSLTICEIGDFERLPSPLSAFSSIYFRTLSFY